MVRFFPSGPLRNFYEHMFGTIKNRFLDSIDLAVEFSTLGEYRLDGPIAVGGPASGHCSSSSFDWPAPCEGSARRRAGARVNSDVC